MFGKKTLGLGGCLLTAIALMSFIPNMGTTKVKCMLQLTNYSGEGAYVVVSILNAEGAYEDTLYVQGEDNEWYRDIAAWWKNVYGIKRPDLDAVVGETVAGGQRKMVILNIPSDKIDAGYRIRFESAVEDREYFEEDLGFDLTTGNLNGKMEGSGFIRYVRMMPQ